MVVVVVVVILFLDNRPKTTNLVFTRTNAQWVIHGFK